ncbi:hypothetical protein [Pelagibius marinus]|nr:hypothetical protein [Pelagibius marinus]
MARLQVVGLVEAGGPDDLGKPVDLRELLARIKTVRGADYIYSTGKS